MKKPTVSAATWSLGILLLLQAPVFVQGSPQKRPANHLPATGGFANPGNAYDGSPTSVAGASISRHCHLVCTTPETITTTWFGFEPGWAPTTLYVRWYAAISFAIYSAGYTGFAEAKVEYSVDGGASFISVSASPFTKTQTGFGLKTYTKPWSDAVIPLPLNQDVTQIQVRATLTAQMPSCGSSCNNVSGTTAALQVADIWMDTACDLPVGETTSSLGWSNFAPQRTTHYFEQTLTPAASNDFEGRRIKEEDPVPEGGAVDSCHFPDSEVEEQTSVISGGEWDVLPGNFYAPDQVGWYEGPVNFYQGDPRTPLPCSLRGPQRMLISCRNPTEFVPYAQHELVDGIQSSSVSATRQGNYQSRPWP